MVWKSLGGEFFPRVLSVCVGKGVRVRRAGGNLEARPSGSRRAAFLRLLPVGACEMMDISASLFFVFLLTLEEFKSLEERALTLLQLHKQAVLRWLKLNGVFFGRGERRPQMPFFGKGLSRSHGCDMGVKLVGIAKIGTLLPSLGCFPVNSLTRSLSPHGVWA